MTWKTEANGVPSMSLSERIEQAPLSLSLSLSVLKGDGSRSRRAHPVASDEILSCPKNMGRVFRNGDHVLLGHAPRDPFAGTPSGFPPADIDVDFSDVFGGPPRRSSGPETRGGLSDGGRGVGGEAARGPCRPCSCSFGEEMPVFGGGGSPASSHRRQLGDDFYDDVFKGNNGSPCYSPRKMCRDPFASTPGSRVLSPARPLPPTSDVFSGGSSRPAKLSFSTRPAKGSDRLEFSSPTPDVLYKNDKSIPGAFSFPSPIANAPTNLSRLLQTKDDSKCDTCASFNGSTLHHQTPHSQYRSSEGTRLACSETNDTDRQFKNDTSGLQAYSGSDYFHFSIYKWANIGVTLVMPYNLNERIKSGIKVNGVSTQISQVEDLLPENRSTLQGCGAFQNQTDLEDECQLNDLAAAKNHDISMTKEVKEVLPASPVTKSIQSDITDASGDKEITGQIANKESMVKDYTVKDANDTATLVHKTGENMFSSQTEEAMLKMHGTLATMEDNMHGRRAKGKVKEFIKIFNQEHAPRSGSTVENRAGKFRIGNEVKGRQETCLSARVANTDENEKLKVEDVALSTPAAANQNLGISEENMQKIEDSSPEVKSFSNLLSDSTLDILDAPVCNIEEAYIENIDECLVEELPPNQNEVTGTALHWEEVRTADAKIREWSKGKEGNIRSLLSTLQYVLWPGSGWKPIPLVDIIEGASVRRAYQKALLCLHPDKLLQKGAEIHQKYIAEKVFDILQEAWTQFNSVSSL